MKIWIMNWLEIKAFENKNWLIELELRLYFKISQLCLSKLLLSDLIIIIHFLMKNCFQKNLLLYIYKFKNYKS